MRSSSKYEDEWQIIKEDREHQVTENHNIFS